MSKKQEKIEAVPSEEQKLEAKVDQMLDIKQPDAAKSDAAKPAGKQTDVPPIDIFSDPKTAPDVPEAVLKTVAESTPEVSTDAPLEDMPETIDASVNPDPLDDPKSDELVNEITVQEGDELLAAEDEKTQKPVAAKLNFAGRIKNFFAAWWSNKRARWGSIAGVILLLAVLGTVPTTRAFALNLMGMRAKATLTVLDKTTDLPLKNVQVQLGSQTATTNAHGVVSFSHVKLGSQTLIAQKVAFATYNHKVNVNLGGNHLPQVQLVAVGTQYHFSLTDYVSGKPITNANAVSGAADAEADSKGTIILTANNPDTSKIAVTITAANHRTEIVNVPVGSIAVTKLQLVPSRKEVFVSNQSGKYDVYKEDVDGKNKKLLLPGTGTENNQITLIANTDGSEVALVSTRDNVHDNGGYLEQTLTLISVADGSDVTIDHSDRIHIVDWVGDRLVYVEVKPGASAANPQRNQLMSYDYQTKQRLALAHANYFNDVVSAGGAIYYATSNAYSGGVSQFAKINSDNTDAQVLLTDEVWNIFRVGYSNFVLDSSTNWYTYQLGDTKPARVANEPANTTTRVYLSSPDGKHSLWTDTRDGKGVLSVYDTTTKKDTVLTEQSGLAYPVRWLNDTTVIYRVGTPNQTADYVVSLLGGKPKKITDLNNVAGIGPWYYY